MRIGHHDRAGLGVERLDLAHPVGLLDGRSELVPAHSAVLVAGDGRDAGEPRLPQALPHRAVGIVVRAGVTQHHALGDHAGQVLRRLGVDRVAVGIGALGQVDLGLGDVQEAPRLAARALARLRAREHVIGRREHLPGPCRHGAQGPERLDERQSPLLFWPGPVYQLGPRRLDRPTYAGLPGFLMVNAACAMPRGSAPCLRQLGRARHHARPARIPLGGAASRRNAPH